MTTRYPLVLNGTSIQELQSGDLIPTDAGGTNANITAAAGAVVYSTASALAVSAVGSSGQLLQSNGTSAPSWTTPTYASTGKAIAMSMIFGF